MNILAPEIHQSPCSSIRRICSKRKLNTARSKTNSQSKEFNRLKIKQNNFSYLSLSPPRFKNYKKFETLNYDAAKDFMKEMFVKQKDDVESSKLYRGEIVGSIV